MYQQERILKETAGEDFEMRKMLRLQKIQPHVQEIKNLDRDRTVQHTAKKCYW